MKHIVTYFNSHTIKTNRVLFKKKSFQSDYLAKQKFLFRKFNKDERKGDFVILHLNPDIFHETNRIMELAGRFDRGEKMPDIITALEICELKHIIQGESEIPFIPDFKGNILSLIHI